MYRVQTDSEKAISSLKGWVSRYGHIQELEGIVDIEKLEKVTGKSHAHCQNGQCPNEDQFFPRDKMIEYQKLVFCSKECSQQFKHLEI